MTRESEQVAALHAALGERLKLHRKQNGLNQLDLAESLHYDRTSITKIEAGKQHAPEQFWREADRLLDTDGELLAAFNVLTSASAIYLAIELESLSRDVSEHSRRVLMGEEANWNKLAERLNYMLLACRRHATLEPSTQGTTRNRAPNSQCVTELATRLQ